MFKFFYGHVLACDLGVIAWRKLMTCQHEQLVLHSCRTASRIGQHSAAQRSHTAIVGMRKKTSYRLFTAGNRFGLDLYPADSSLHIQAPTVAQQNVIWMSQQSDAWVRDWSNCQCAFYVSRDWSKRVVCTTQRTSACIYAQCSARNAHVCALESVDPRRSGEATTRKPEQCVIQEQGCDS
jgi:hypothetical protein